MFDKYIDGSLMNCYFLDDVYQDPHNLKRVIFIRVNGSTKIEEYDTEEEAKQRVSTLIQKLMA